MRKFIYAIIIATTAFACSEEDINVLEDPSTGKGSGNLTTENGRVENNYVRPFHTSTTQSEGCKLYSTYAAVGLNQTNYARRVTITVKEGNNQLQQVNVTINAGSSTSNSAAILRNATEDYGSVKLEVTRVRNLSSGAIDYSANWEESSFNANNCFTEEHDGGGGILQCPVPCEIIHPGGGLLDVG